MSFPANISHTRYINWVIAQKLIAVEAATVLDIGGIRRFRGQEFEVKDANIKSGIDGCKLPYENNSFHASISVATIEHVSDYEVCFLEAIRVASYISVHFLPLGEVARETDIIKRRFGRKHLTVKIPDVAEVHDLLCSVQGISFEIYPLISIPSHLLYLATISPRIICPELWEFVFNYRNEFYGWIVSINKGRT